MDKYNDIIEKVEKLSALELSELVHALEEKFGVSAAMPVAAAAGGEEVEEKTTVTLELKSGGEQKIQVIKVLREVLGLGLKEAKDFVDAAPKVIKEGIRREEADELKAKIEAAGATVEVK